MKIVVRTIFAIFLLNLSVISVLIAQKTVVSGIISDVENKEKLPFVNIYFTNSTTGVTSDLYGSFHLETTNLGLTSITFDYLGYNNKVINITPGKSQTITIELVSNTAKLDEVVVKAKRKVKKDTAAIVLYRNVVKNKAKNRLTNLDYYAYEEYAKTEFDLYNLSEKFKKRKVLKPFDFVFDNVDTTDSGIEFLPVLLKESITDYYYAKDPTRKKQIVKADQFSGIQNVSVSGLVDFSFEEVDVYNGIIRVNNKPFISPFANGALTNYKYFLADSSTIDGLWCYKLEFTGKRKGDLAFSGYAWIHDGTFAIKSIELYILPNINLNFINDFGLRQKFSLRENKYWFKDEEYIYSSLNVSQDKEKQSFMIKRTTTRDKIKLNEPIQEKIFAGAEKEVNVDAKNRDEDYWATARHLDLSRQEKSVYTTIDSVKSTKAYKLINWLGYLGTTAYFKAGPVEFGRFYKFYSFNAIEGHRLRFGGRTNPQFSKKIRLDGYGAYGLLDKQWKYNAGLRLNLAGEKTLWSGLAAFYRFDMAQLNQKDPLITHDNLALSVFRKKFWNREYWIKDLLKARQAYIHYEKEIVEGLTEKLTFNHRTFYSVEIKRDLGNGLTDTVGISFKQYDQNDGLVSINQFNSTEVSLETMWGPGQKWFESYFGRAPLTFNKPVTTFNYTLGFITDLNSKNYNFHKLELHVRHNWANKLGTTKYQLFAGKVFGQAPYPLLTMHQGNQSLVYNRFAFNLMSEFEFISDQYAALWINHHFNGLIMNRIPLIKKLKLRSLISGKILYGNMTDKNKNLILLPEGASSLDDQYPIEGANPITYKNSEKYYLELGVGLENIFKVIRVEAIWRITQRDKLDVTKWGVRIALAPSL